MTRLGAQRNYFTASPITVIIAMVAAPLLQLLTTLKQLTAVIIETGCN